MSGRKEINKLNFLVAQNGPFGTPQPLSWTLPQSSLGKVFYVSHLFACSFPGNEAHNFFWGPKWGLWGPESSCSKSLYAFSVQ